jgi:uncharacterized repeat protein (TIGR01451 family)
MFSAASAPPAPPPSASFLALGDNAVSFNPDTQGAVGPNHLMVTLGSQVRIQDRAGAAISTVSLDAFWGSLGDSNVFDPRILYDSLSNRWITAAISNPGTNNSSLLVAVSQTSDPTGVWFRHQIRVDLTDGLYAAGPNLGLSRDWLVVSAAMRDKTGLFFYSADIFVFSLTNLYAGGPAEVLLREQYAPSTSTIDELNIPVPALSFDRSYPTNFLVANWDGSLGGGPGRLRLFSVSGPVNAPVFEDYAAQGGLFVSAGAAWGNPSWVGSPPGNTNFAPQLGSSTRIFIGDSRIQNVIYRNGLLWCAHHIFLPTNAPTRCAVQWWCATPGGTVFQHGRMDDPTGVRFYAYPSIAVNQYDDVLLGYSRFAANQYPSANYAFHGYQDTPGRLSTDTVLKAGEAKFAVAQEDDVLWGDWSASVVDPLNDTDLWTIQEYAAAPVGGIDRWGTWWGRISPSVNLSLRAADSPDPVLAGSNVTYSIQITNNGAHVATGVRLVDTLPPGATFVSASASQGVCGHTNGVVTCNFGDVAGTGGTNVVVVSATIVAQLFQGGTATNSLSLLSFGSDVNPADNSAKVTTTVTTAADLAVTMAASTSLVVLSNNVTYTLTVTNRGPLAAGSTVLTNVLPPGLVFVSATPSVGSCSHSAGRVSCAFATLGVNAGASVTLVAHAVGSGFQTNVASASSASLDPVPTNNLASATVKASAAPTLQAISSRTITEDMVLGPLAFTIGDLETPADSLVLTYSSSNTNLVPAVPQAGGPAGQQAGVSFGGSGTDRFFTVTPLANSNGVVDITRTVRDADGLTASNTFRLTVTAVNDPPGITDIPAQTLAEDGTLGPLNFTIGDVETAAASLNVSAASSNPALIPNANIQLGGSGANRTVTVRPATNQFGTATITITVSDGVGTTNDTFLVTVNSVNDLPTINDVSARTLPEDSAAGTTIGLAIGDAETAATALAMSGTSSNLTLVPNANITFAGTGNSRSVTVVPAPNQFGTSLITLTVTDGDGGSASDTFLLTVNPVNDPPTLNTNAPLVINEDAGTTNVTLLGLSSGASNELQSLTITASSSRPALIPAPVVTDSNGVETATFNPGGAAFSARLRLVPVPDSNGVATITVTVNDGGASNNVITRTFNVTVNAVNDAPTISAFTNVVIAEDSRTDPIPFVIGDVDSPLAGLSVAASSSDTNLVPNANVVLNGSGAAWTVSATPAPNRTGVATITVSASDGAATNSGNFLITVSPVNDPPSLSLSTNQITVNEDEAASVVLTVGEVETPLDALTFSAASTDTNLVPVGSVNGIAGTIPLTDPPPSPGVWFSGSGSNRLVTILPATNLSGSATIDLTVADGDGGQQSVSVVFTVLPVNDPPGLEAIGDVLIEEDAPRQSVPLSGINSGAANESQSLAVSAVSDNPGLIGGLTVVYTSPQSMGRLEFTPLPDANGSATVTVRVSDGEATNSHTFNVTVSAVNDPPSLGAIEPIVTAEDSPLSVPLVLADPDSPADALQVQAGSSNPELLDESGISITGEGTNRTLRLTPLLNQSGQSTTITVTVSDGSDEASVNFDLTVLPVNDPPSVNGLADLSIDQDSGPTNLVFTVSDPESIPSSLLVSAASDNQTLLPDANLQITGNGTTRTLTLSPLAGQTGTASVQVVVRDGAGASAGATTNSFTLTVRLMLVTLRIERAGDTAVVSWPASAVGWTLQSTTNMALPGSWGNVLTPPSVVNDHFMMTNTVGESMLFYRLRRP